LIERLDAAGVDGLLQGQRSIRPIVFDQHAVSGRIADGMLGGVVLADDAVTVDVARAVGMPDGLACFSSRPIEIELIERAVEIPRCECREMTGGIVIGAGDRAVAIDRLPEGQIAVGKEALDQRGKAAGIDDIMLGCVI
jgi:hypothetical protein